jgi:hypothetical protein
MQAAESTGMEMIELIGQIHLLFDEGIDHYGAHKVR